MWTVLAVAAAGLVLLANVFFIRAALERIEDLEKRIVAASERSEAHLQSLIHSLKWLPHELAATQANGEPKVASTPRVIVAAGGPTRGP